MCFDISALIKSSNFMFALTFESWIKTETTLRFLWYLRTDHKQQLYISSGIWALTKSSNFMFAMTSERWLKAATSLRLLWSLTKATTALNLLWLLSKIRKDFTFSLTSDQNQQRLYLCSDHWGLTKNTKDFMFVPTSERCPKAATLCLLWHLRADQE